MMSMRREQIEAELARLDERIASAREPTHQIEALQLRQAKFRREMLQAELRGRSNQKEI
jgi:hypothetical protein